MAALRILLLIIVTNYIDTYPKAYASCWHQEGMKPMKEAQQSPQDLVV